MNSKTLHRQYKHKVSNFKDWEQKEHAHEYLIYPENITAQLSIDEVSLSKGEIFTIITNKTTNNKNKKSLVAIINGTEASVIQNVLEKINIEIRKKVKEVSMDMALAILRSFPNAKHVIDRFHVVKLVLDALQHIRVKYRWEVIEQENELIKLAKQRGKKYQHDILSNGDTLRELLVRSRYLLYKKEDEWTKNQQKRASILFEKFPLLKKLYNLTLYFRSIYTCKDKDEATKSFLLWKEKVEKLNVNEFMSCVNSLEFYFDKIMNYFDNKSTNAYAESFNAKIKRFRQNAKGVKDTRFFLFRIQNLFA